MKKNLSRELIVSTAFKMIDEKGTDAFSVRKLASILNVQVSSLYNYIDNEYDLLLEVAMCAAEMYSNYISKTVKGLDREKAAYKAGDAFRDFVVNHKYLYELLLDSRWTGDPNFIKVNKKFTEPISFLTFDGIEDIKEMEHIYVAMRVVTHGFASLDSLGIFDELSIDRTESYHRLVKSVIDMMNNLENKK